MERHDDKKKPRPDGVEAGARNSRDALSTGNLNQNWRRVKRADGKPVGHVEDSFFIKRVDRRTHMLKRPPAWACDVCSLEQAHELGAERVRLLDFDGTIWEASLRAFWKKGSFRVERGFGEQRALKLTKWTRRGKGIPEQLTLSLNWEAAS